jgi:alkylated DNA repair dioxygenase AlkB
MGFVTSRLPETLINLASSKSNITGTCNVAHTSKPKSRIRACLPGPARGTSTQPEAVVMLFASKGVGLGTSKDEQVKFSVVGYSAGSSCPFAWSPASHSPHPTKEGRQMVRNIYI